MVKFTDAVAHPGAVMIHTKNAFLADAAVVSACFLDEITLEAISHAIQRFDLLSASRIAYRLISPFFLAAARHSFFISFSFRVLSLISSISSL